MPLGADIRYRMKPGTNVRLAFKGDRVVEAKNTVTGATHSEQEFDDDAAAREKDKDRPARRRKTVRGGKTGRQARRAPRRM